MSDTANKKVLTCRPIGTIHTPYSGREDTPKNRAEAPDAEAVLELSEEYREAMADIRPGQDYLVLFWFDRAGEVHQTVPMHGDGPLTGLFSTHAPARPNPIGLSKISVTKIEGTKVYFRGADMFDGTPVLDIKSAGHDI